jgi:hypothetical protein
MGGAIRLAANVTGATLPSNIVTGQDAVLEDKAQAGMSGADALARSQQTVPSITGGDLDAGQPRTVPAISGDIHGADQREIASPAAKDEHDVVGNDNQYAEQSTPGADVATAPPRLLARQPQAGLTDARPDPPALDRQSGDAAIEPAQRPHTESADTPAPASTRWQTMRPFVTKMLPYAPVVLDGLAAGLSGATANLSAYPMAPRATGAVSGVLWLVSAAGLQYSTPRSDYVGMTSNVLGGTAGILALTDALVPSKDTAGVGYGSAGAWVGGGLASILHAVSLRSGAASDPGVLANRLGNSGALASGLANTGAAIFSAAASDSTAHGKTAVSEILGTSSAVLWFTGTVGLGLTAWAAYSAGLGNTGTPRLPDLEASLTPIELSDRNQAPGNPGAPQSSAAEANTPPIEPSTRDPAPGSPRTAPSPDAEANTNTDRTSDTRSSEECAVVRHRQIEAQEADD